MSATEQFPPLSQASPESEPGELTSDSKVRREELRAKFKAMIESDGPNKWSPERIEERNEILHQITAASKEIHGIKEVI